MDQASKPSQENLFANGLDSIRFFCAVWVVFGHFGLPELPFDKSTTIGLYATGVYNNLTSGPAAVIVFFIVSGLCIHLAHVESLNIPNVSAFIMRRYIRIFPPMAVAIFIANELGVKLALFEETILWSLFAELVYYTIYPLLLRLRLLFGSWSWLILMSFVLGLLVAATDPSAKNYPSFGIGLNWLLGLPCWLFGCALAERFRRPTLDSWGSIYWWRAGVFFLSVAFSIARFHTPVGYPWTLNVFGIFAAVWLFQELVHFQRRSPCTMLERAGQWSYSLYLVHSLAIAVLAREFLYVDRSLTSWLLQFVFILLFSFFFAQLVEYPSHRVARKVARWILQRKASACAGSLPEADKGS